VSVDLRSGRPEPFDFPPVNPPTALAWHVSPPLKWAKVAAFLAFALVACIYRDEPTRAFAAGVGALLIGVYAARDVIAPVRLAADADGVTVVNGYASKQRLPWSAIERVRVDRHSRLGLRTEMLEVDAGESVHLFSTYDLNAPCSEVEESLNQLRPA
jgi:Bacterial PH domain